jgi:DNA polymerase-3 subunit chi
MTDIGFYHLTRTGLDRALPQLLAKTLAAQKRALVLVSSDQMAKMLDDALWTFDKSSWLPHGMTKGGSESDQPVLISDRR